MGNTSENVVHVNFRKPPPTIQSEFEAGIAAETARYGAAFVFVGAIAALLLFTR